jgi:hypothetical protein
MQRPKDTFCGVFEHVYTLFFRDDVVCQKPFAYTNDDINYKPIVFGVLMFFLYQKKLCQNIIFMLILGGISTTLKLDKWCIFCVYLSISTKIIK